MLWLNVQLPSKNVVAKRAIAKQAKMLWLNVPSASKNVVAKRAIAKQKCCG